jgi:GNAT superfamily N-acetyltransferase
MIEPPIRPAEPVEGKALAQVIADAFHALPITAWLVPDPADRREIMPADFQLFVDHAIEHGTVHTTDRLDAVAVWLPNAPAGTPPIPDYDRRLSAVGRQYTENFRVLDETFEHMHPSGPPHEYLMLLAVAPGRQSRGLGGRLMRAHLDALDRAGVPAYLEASSPRSRQFYLCHGFVDVNAPFTPPGGPESALWPMWRAPA